MALGLANATAMAGASSGAAARSSVYAFANRCVSLRSVSARHLVASKLYLKPTALGRYMLYDGTGMLISAGAHQISRVHTAGPSTEWAPSALRRAPSAIRGASFTIRSTANGRRLAVASHGGGLMLSATRGRRARFQFVAAKGCRPFPEAQADASGKTFRGTNRNGTVFGFVDDHLHITANMRGGGLVISGEPFDRFGIPAALGQDVKVHGADGSLDITGNLLRNGVPTGTHDTHGWPTFTGWPTFNTQTHQQTYYVWLQRAWEAGERMVVAQTADDAPMCKVEPRRTRATCGETASIDAQIHTLRALQGYVDAHAGGPGRGWFRLVYSPSKARRVIEQGKLAVVIGIESSDLFGCSEFEAKPQCTRGDVVRGIRDYKRSGVRGMFVAHWVDNAFGGSALEGGAKGIFINILNRGQTGGYFATGACPSPTQGETIATLSQPLLQFLSTFFPATKPIASQPMPTYPPGNQCNTDGLTDLGRFMIDQMIKQHMLIEVDHLSERARDAVLEIAARAHYAGVISGHNGTGGSWTTAEVIKLYRLGGFAAVTPDQAPALVAKILAMSRYHPGSRFFGVGIGTDTGGFASLPGPRSNATTRPLRYPFKSYDGNVTFSRERTGKRAFDLNRDGVAHYGLVADLLADMRQAPGGRKALALLFGSAEAYLETWQRAVAHR
jgi:microsomal dipeptidase-like Zn-dependent dipeptidase